MTALQSLVEITGVEKCTVDDIGLKITGKDAPPVIDSINEYLSLFAKPVEYGEDSNFVFGKHKCFKCDSPLGGIAGSFRWGICSGEGACTKCGWPARAHHYPEDEEGKIFDGPLEIVLQYHPDGVTTKE